MLSVKRSHFLNFLKNDVKKISNKLYNFDTYLTTSFNF